MRLLVRFGFFAVLLGALLGVLLRVSLGRKRFSLVAALALLPLAVHAGYLLVLAVRAGVGSVPMLVFAAITLVLLVVAALLARTWTTTRPWLVPLAPLAAALVYFFLATLALTPSWENLAYAPNAVAGAVYALATLFAAAVLLPFAPRAAASAQQVTERSG